MRHFLAGRWFKALSLSVVAILTVGTVSPAAARIHATLQTDGRNYNLGEEVWISGSGFAPGAVEMSVVFPNGNPDVYAPPTAVADSDGNFQYFYDAPHLFVPDDETLPGLLSGKYEVIASQGTDQARISFHVFKKSDKQTGRIVLMVRSIASSAVHFPVYLSYGAPMAYPNGLVMSDGFQLDSGYILTPGSYTIVEQSIPSGWYLFSVSIDDQTGRSLVPGPDATVALAAGETVTVTYVNAQIGLADTH